MDRIDAKRSRLVPVLVIAAGLVVFAVMFLRVPLATVFTLGLLLVCPLLMVGMHGGDHGGGHAHHVDEPMEGVGSKGGESRE